MTDINLVTFIPYADDRNLGRACNECMAMLPEDGWAAVLDHDAVFTTPEWHRQLTRAIALYPNGCFTGYSNRSRHPFKAPGVSMNGDDMAYHRGVGEKMLVNEAIRDVTDERGPNGMLIVLSKQAWKAAGGFEEGLHYIDRLMWKSLKMTGHRVYLVEGLYLYHWHRGGRSDVPIQEGPIASRHTLADGRFFQMVDPKTGLPPPDYCSANTYYGQKKA